MFHKTLFCSLRAEKRLVEQRKLNLSIETQTTLISARVKLAHIHHVSVSPDWLTSDF